MGTHTYIYKFYEKPEMRKYKKKSTEEEDDDNDDNGNAKTV